MGYIGPRTKPTKDTAIASPMRDGTRHTMSSKLFWPVSLWGDGDHWESSPDCKEDIEEDGVTIPELSSSR